MLTASNTESSRLLGEPAASRPKSRTEIVMRFATTARKLELLTTRSASNSPTGTTRDWSDIFEETVPAEEDA